MIVRYLSSAVPTTVTIPTGSASATVTVTPVDDDVAEGNETVTLTLGGGTGYVLGAAITDTVTIIDDDVPALSIVADATIISEDGVETITLTITRDSDVMDVTFDLDITGATARDTSADYSTNPATITGLTMTGTTMSIVVTFTAQTDTDAEGDQVFTCEIVPVLLCRAGTPSSVDVTIVDDEAATVWIEATDPDAVEAPSTPDEGTFVVYRRGGPGGDLTVNFTVSTAPGSATEGVDYVSIGTSVVIPSGSDSATVTVTPVNDETGEEDETVTVTLAAGDPVYFLGAVDSGTVTIVDDDLPEISMSVSDADLIFTEDTDTGIDYVFTRSGAGAAALDVEIEVDVTSTATAGTDYTAPSTTVSFGAGESEVTVTVTLLGDTATEADDTLVVSIVEDTSGSPAYLLGAVTTATVTIWDDDPPDVTLEITSETPAVSVLTVVEATGGDITLTVSRGVPCNLHSSLDVNLDLSTGTATVTDDYTLAGVTAGVVTIPAESATADVTLTVVDDSAEEAGEETVVLTLAAGSYTAVTPSTATVTIQDDDVPPGAFNLLAPTNGRAHVALTPVFDWEAAAGAIDYELEIATDITLTTVIHREWNVVALTYTVTDTGLLTAGTRYYWSVEAQNNTDTTQAANAPFTFTVSSDATVNDLDGDGLPNAPTDEEAANLTDPLDWDSDDDGCPDGWEVDWGFDPNVSADGASDPDRDSFTNKEEYQNGTNPLESDLSGFAKGDGCEPVGRTTAPGAGLALALAFALALLARAAAAPRRRED